MLNCYAVHCSNALSPPSVVRYANRPFGHQRSKDRIRNALVRCSEPGLAFGASPECRELPAASSSKCGYYSFCTVAHARSLPASSASSRVPPVHGLQANARPPPCPFDYTQSIVVTYTTTTWGANALAKLGIERCGLGRSALPNRDTISVILLEIDAAETDGYSRG